MPNVTKRKKTSKNANIDWDLIRASYEVGVTQSELARRYGCSQQIISYRAKAEGWEKDSDKEVQRVTKAKLAGLRINNEDSDTYLSMKQDRIEDEANRRARLIARHRDEWQRIRRLNNEAIEFGKFTEKARLAKIAAETASIIQKNERIAWGLDETDKSGEIDWSNIGEKFVDAVDDLQERMTKKQLKKAEVIDI